MTSRVPGLLLASSVAAVAMMLARVSVAPFTLDSGQHPLGASSIAILLGLLLGNLLPLRPGLKPGIAFCTRVILPLGIVLLGARLAFADLMRVGGLGLLLALVAIGTCAAVVAVLIRVFSLPVKLTTLVGVGTAICGGSAIAAAAPAIEAEDEDIAWSVAAVAFLGLVMMFALPLVGHGLEVDPTAFGMWAGLTIHQTPQVVAAGLAYGGEAGEVATLIKLVRVALLAPAVFVIGLVYARSRQAQRSSRVSWLRLMPPFVFGFLAMAAARSFGLLDFGVQLPWNDGATSLLGLARLGDGVALTVAMAAIGLETRLAAFRNTGLKPLAAGVIASVAVAGATYLAILALV
ncbi:MAG: putative sulfate exporter family transporter [Acidobacteriota bacterium]|nr:putative sulfate exporter family transporter [Acidobacteriota bacterium]